MLSNRGCSRTGLGGFIFRLLADALWAREWYVPGASFHARVVPVLDVLIARLHADPGYRSFLLDGQTVLLEDYLQARPDREADVRALVTAGGLSLRPPGVLGRAPVPSGLGPVPQPLPRAADRARGGGRAGGRCSPR